MSGWQPIETLPPNERVLVTNINKQDIAVPVRSCYTNGDGAATPGGIASGQLVGWGRRQDLPTHWQPTPEGPAA